jgi:glutamine amidotransferase
VFEAQHPLLEVKSALEEVAMVIGLQREVLERYDFQPSSLNALITDGTKLLVVRFCDHAT